MSKKVKDESQQEQQNVYKMGAFSKVPTWVTSILLKYWAAAAAVFFSVIGGLDIGLDFSETGEDFYASLAADISTIIIIGLALALVMCEHLPAQRVWFQKAFWVHLQGQGRKTGFRLPASY